MLFKKPRLVSKFQLKPLKIKSSVKKIKETPKNQSVVLYRFRMSGLPSLTGVGPKIFQSQNSKLS